MAVTWRGSTVSPTIYGQGGAYLFALVNSFRSRATVRILYLMAQMETLETATSAVNNAIMPLLITVRCSANSITGGYPIAARSPFDTTVNAADPGVKLLYNPALFGDPSGGISVTPGGRVWEQFTARMVSAYGQVMTWDFSLITRLTTSSSFLLVPGEAIVMQWVANPSGLDTGGIAFVQCAWEEDQTDSGYTLSGQVTLNSTGVTGAKVFLVTDADQDMPNPEIEVITTPSGGTWSKTLGSNVKASAFVQHKSGTDKYTDEGKPYLEKDA